MSERVLASGKPASEWVLFEKRFVVPDYDNPKEPSRIRWRLFHCPYFGIYLHKWFLPDPRETPHNHPWSFFSIILWGWYVEVGHIFKHKRRWLNIVPRERFHAVTEVKPGTLSLMFVGRDTGTWGYLDPGYISFEEHRHSEEFRLAMRQRAA